MKMLKKRLVSFSDPRICQFSHDIIRFDFETDSSLPLAVSNLSRKDIYNYLWKNYAENFALNILSVDDYRNARFWLPVHNILYLFSEILSYPLAEKKPSGLAANTNNKFAIAYKDCVLPKIMSAYEILKEVNLDNIHLRFYPLMEKQIFDLLHLHQRTINLYISAYRDREEKFISNALVSIDRLRSAGIDDVEIRKIIRTTISYYEKQGFIIHVKSLSRFMGKDFYNYRHLEFYSSEAKEFLATFTIIKTPTKELLNRRLTKSVERKNLKFLENSGSRKAYIFPDSYSVANRSKYKQSDRFL